MPLKARISMLLALSAACTSTRPEGAYTPEYKAPGASCEPMPGIPNPCGEDAGEDDAEEPTDDDVPSDDDIPTDDDVPVDDGGMEQLDAGPIDPANPLAKLAGRYLMRVDYYSTAEGQDTTTNATLRVKNRVSNLFLTTLTAGEGGLQATEQLCLQSSAHQCLSSCSGWNTQYDADLPPLYAAKSKVQRTWTVDATSRLLTVKSDGALLPLGFDPIGGQYTLPTDINASNVWQPGTSSVQRALHTYITGRLMAAIVSADLTCHINSVMVFATAFERALPSLEADALNSFVAEVDSTGSNASPIAASGGPSQFCDINKLKSGGGSEETAFVRFKRTTLTSCPTTAAAYDRQFPPATGTELDPPSL